MGAGVTLGAVTHEKKRFTTVSELKNFISLTADRSIDHPNPMQHSANETWKEIIIYQIIII